jgi:hypothetical protein
MRDKTISVNLSNKILKKINNKGATALRQY